MRSLCILLALSLSALATPCLAQSNYSRAEQALEELEFELAGRLFKKALSEPGTRKERLGTYRGLGLVSAFQGDAKTAKVYFEKLVLMDPSAQIDTSLGPKITKPFEQAKAAMASKKNELSLLREASGQVHVELTQDVILATELSLNARAETGEYKNVTAKIGNPVSADFSPNDSVEAWAQALDNAGGVIYEQGTKDAPLRFEGNRPKPLGSPTVASAPEGATKDLGEALKSDDEPHAKGAAWPWIVGASVVVLGGVAAGIAVANQPPALNLPPADKKIDLP